MTNMKQIYSKIAETAGLLNGCFKKVDKEIKRINSEPVSSEHTHEQKLLCTSKGAAEQVKHCLVDLKDVSFIFDDNTL